MQRIRQRGPVVMPIECAASPYVLEGINRGLLRVIVEDGSDEMLVALASAGPLEG